MPQYLTEWVTAFNTDWKIAFGFDQQSEQPQPYRCGMPQGSPVSPALYLIYSNAMLERSHQAHNVIDTSYVDDVCMVQLSTAIIRANTLLEERTEEHLSRGVQLGLTFAPPKTELQKFVRSPFLLKSSHEQRERERKRFDKMIVSLTCDDLLFLFLCRSM